VEFESKFKEWLEPTRDKLYKGLLDNAPLNELNAYKGLVRYFKFLLEEDKYAHLSCGRIPNSRELQWSTLSQKLRNQFIVDFFTGKTDLLLDWNEPYGKTLLPLLPEDIKNYILAHSL
jgi:hypothetical protein